MLDEALRDHVAELGNQSLIHEHLIKFTLFGVDQQAANRLIEVIEDFLEVGSRLNHGILGNDEVKDLEEAVDVAVGDLEGDDGALDHKQGEAAFE